MKIKHTEVEVAFDLNQFLNTFKLVCHNFKINLIDLFTYYDKAGNYYLNSKKELKEIINSLGFDLNITEIGEVFQKYEKNERF